MIYVYIYVCNDGILFNKFNYVLINHACILELYRNLFPLNNLSLYF